MLDTSVDAWYTWVGVALTSIALFGVVTSLPTTAPPDAAAASRTIDVVAAATYPSTATHPVDATETKLTADSVALRNDGAVRAASVRFGPITPAITQRLGRVARGTPARQLFESPEAFANATEHARERPGEWHPVDGALVVRKVTWEGRDVTLVAA